MCWRRTGSGYARQQAPATTDSEIVRALRPVGTWHGTAQNLALPLGDLPADATDVAVIVQSSDQGRILGAATLALH